MITERRNEYSENITVATIYSHGTYPNGDSYIVVRMDDGRCVEHEVAMQVTLSEYPIGSKVRFSTRVEPLPPE